MRNPVQKHQTQVEPTRPTIIRTPRNDAMFPGWGVKF